MNTYLVAPLYGPPTSMLESARGRGEFFKAETMEQALETFAQKMNNEMVLPLPLKVVARWIGEINHITALIHNPYKIVIDTKPDLC